MNKPAFKEGNTGSRGRPKGGKNKNSILISQGFLSH